MQQEFESIIKL